MRIQLNHEWILGERIDGGAYGKVYAAKSVDYESAAVKLVPKAPGAKRELLFDVDLAGARNVVPIIDSGQAGDNWVLVMLRAEKSLHQHLKEVTGPLSIAEAVSVLSDIALALTDLDGRVVHRDLKPRNTLLLGGYWCLADFGISRYAEATTAPDTRKHALTPEYAAPERWRHERATTATDVYSLGVVAHELLSRSLPFPGPYLDDFREQHLHRDPVHLDHVPAPLAALVEECLYKAPGARPSPSNLLARLARIADTPKSPGLAKLQQVNRAGAIVRGVAARLESERQSETERRIALNAAAKHGLKQVADALKEAIAQAAPIASLSVGLDIGWTAVFSQAQLRLEQPAVTPPQPWGQWWCPAFEVIAHSNVSIQFAPNSYGYEGRSHSLWYCDAQEARKYQWIETAFMVSSLIPKHGRQDPFALNPGEDAAKAVGIGMAEYQVAWPFTVISIGDLDEFIGRWAGWFADAIQGRLNRPSTMPERQPHGSWRQT